MCKRTSNAVILARMHNQNHACSCTYKLSASAHGDPSDLYPHSVTVHIQQNSHVITLIEFMTAAFLDVSDDPNWLSWKMI